MRIAILSRYQNINQRGVEAFVKELVPHLAKSHQVDVLTDSDSDSISKMLQGKYDAIIPLNGRMQSLKASVTRIFGKHKLVISGHSGIGHDDIWNIVVARPNVFVALTDAMANWAKKWAMGVKIIKINNGVDTSHFIASGENIKIDLPKPIILSVGALEWYKHHEQLIDAVSKLDKGSVLIVGKGSLKEKLEKVGNKKLPNRFKIVDLNYKEMPKVYRSADLFSLPSWDREAFGIVYLEAMASCLPVVAPNDYSRREIIADAGVFVDVSDASAYSQAITKALNTNWGNKPREQAEKFSWERVAKQYEKMLIEITNE
jgi:glycosyltransferase involved in cell wall biosynthesis